MKCLWITATYYRVVAHVVDSPEARTVTGKHLFESHRLLVELVAGSWTFEKVSKTWKVPIQFDPYR